MEPPSSSKKNALTIFGLAMINVAAIGSIKNWPLLAEHGFNSLFFLILASFIFFIPLSLVSAELATGWPHLGGIYVWVKEAFGHRWGFLAAWLLWIENVFWYPTILSFITASIAYIFDPSLAENKLFSLFTMIPLFWITTFINLRGMKISSAITSISVILGSFIPAFFIIMLSLSWLLGEKPIALEFSMNKLLPNFNNLNDLVVFIGILFTLAGIEMSGVHAQDVNNPKKDYPKAIFLSVFLILMLYILGFFSIAIVIPQNDISLVSGALQAFSHFVSAYNLKCLTPYLAVLLALGAIGSMSTWTVGPVKSLLAAAKAGDLPAWTCDLNKYGMPYKLLMVQASFVSIISLLFLTMPSVSQAFWMISVIAAQLYVLMYILLFLAALKLRSSQPNTPRAYKVPGGSLGMKICVSLGLLSCILALLVGFLKPSQIPDNYYGSYLKIIISGILITSSIPFLFNLGKLIHGKRKK
ncbi:MAG: amino acid permease [Rhabdochlamydiaceae bacterium]